MKPNIKSASALKIQNVANRDAERAHSKTSDGKRKIPLKNIVVLEGFNEGRLEEDFTPEALEPLVQSIIFHRKLLIPLIGLLLADGTFILVDGERRLRSILIAIERDKDLKKEFEHVECLLAPKDSTEVDRVIMMLMTQSQKHFDPVKEGELYKKLRDGFNGAEGMTPTQIAAKVARSLQHVETRLILADESPEMKQLISEGKVTPTVTVALNRQEADPLKRVNTVKEKNQTGHKLKVKDVKHAPGVYLCQEVINELADIIETEDNPEKANALMNLQGKVRKIKKTIQ